MITDQSLSEAVIALQRQDLGPEARHVIEEAARLLGEGRDMEARALVEKAEALAAQHANGKGTVGIPNGTTGNGASKVNGNAAALPPTIIAPMAAKLAAGFTSVMTDVLQDVHRYTGEQIQAVGRALEERILTIQTAIRSVAGLEERLDQLATIQDARFQSVHQAHEEIWGAVRALQQTDQEQAASIAKTTATTEALSQRMQQQADGVAARFATVEERVSVLDKVTQELQPQVSSVITRLDRHTDALRLLEQRQAQRVSSLHQVLEGLAKLREPTPAEQQPLPALN